jgi:PAS domain S-box-containing protein
VVTVERQDDDDPRDLAVSRALDGLGDPDVARRELLDLATAAAGIGTFDWDLPSGALVWDQRLLDLFGYDAADFDQTIDGFNARLHPDDVPWVSAALERAIADGGDVEFEYRVLAPGQPLRWLAARGRALADEQGRTVRLLGAAWDVTGRRQAQDRVAGILETMAVGFLAVDRSWRVTDLNTEAERLLGTPRAELIGADLWERFPGAVGTDIEASYRQALATGEPVALEAFYPGPQLWVEVRAVPGDGGLALYLLDITDRRAVRVDAERAAGRERLLSRITEELSGTLDADEAANRLCRLVVPGVADWAIVTLADDDRAAGTRRGLRHAASWHDDPELRSVTGAYAASRLGSLTDDAVIVRALASGQPQMISGGATSTTTDMVAPGPVREMLHVLAPEAVAVLPLPGRDGPVGILTLCHGAERGPFTREDMTTARHVAARSGLVLDNARLYRQQRDLAAGLQRSLLTEPPEPDHAQVVVRYVPAAQAAEVGGDWYDSFLQPNGSTVLVIGDVVGHDTRAAAIMGQIRTIVRTLGAEDDLPPAEVLRRTDRVMETLRTGSAATAVVARLEQEPDERERGLTRLRWSNAGHPPPMVLQPDGTVLALATATADRLLGVTPDAPRRESVVALDRDAVVLLYTDGLVERRDQNLDDGLARLERTLAELAGRELDDLCDELLERMLPVNPDDDVALVAVRLHPQDRPRPAEAGPNRVPPNVPDEPAG